MQIRKKAPVVRRQTKREYVDALARWNAMPLVSMGESGRAADSALAEANRLVAEVRAQREAAKSG